MTGFDGTGALRRSKPVRELVNHTFRLAAGVCLFVVTAGATVLPIDISSQANSPWCGTLQMVVNCATLPSGTQSFLGIPFEIPGDPNSPNANNAWFADTAAGAGPNTVSVTIPVNVFGVSTVHTIINTFWGQPGPASFATITFNGTSGLTFSQDLVGNDDIRDYNNWVWTNLINGTTTREGWTNNIGQRLDVQTFTLPAAFQSNTLQSITLTDTGNVNFQRTFLAGVTVDTTVIPEPSYAAAIAATFAALAAWSSRRRRAV